MNVYCDDGSTTIKLAWNDNGKICKSLSLISSWMEG
ncbi:plasmid segregation protein ParM [Escherichia coli]|nr:plasmid segregation protein ParM [Escherichia coli]